MEQTITGGDNYGTTMHHCGYCGNWHSYSREMCKDMASRPVLSNPFYQSNYWEQEVIRLHGRIEELEKALASVLLRHVGQVVVPID